MSILFAQRRQSHPTLEPFLKRSLAAALIQRTSEFSFSRNASSSGAFHLKSNSSVDEQPLKKELKLRRAFMLDCDEPIVTETTTPNEDKRQYG